MVCDYEIAHFVYNGVPQLAYWPIGSFLHPCESHLHSLLCLRPKS